MFVRIGSTWTEVQKLTASDAQEADNFGDAVTVFGNYALVGAGAEDHAGSNSGAAYLFERNVGTWEQRCKLTAAEAVERERFGVSAAQWQQTFVIGAPGTGYAYVFAIPSSTP